MAIVVCRVKRSWLTLHICLRFQNKSRTTQNSIQLFFVSAVVFGMSRICGNCEQAASDRSADIITCWALQTILSRQIRQSPDRFCEDDG